MNAADKELLELAAKAAGIPGVYRVNGYRRISGICETMDSELWNPLTDDGDALRLAVKLNLIVLQQPSQSIATVDVHGFQEEVDEPYNGDPYAATRRAIVRAAAEIGRTMP